MSCTARSAARRACAGKGGTRAAAGGADGASCWTTESASRSIWKRCALVESACGGLGDAVEPGVDSGADAARPLRRRADGRGAQVRDPAARAPDREGPGVQLRHARGCCCTRSGARCWARKQRRPDAQDRATPSTSPVRAKRGVEAELLDRAAGRLRSEAASARALDATRDLQFGYLGLQTLYDRYFLHIGGRADRAAAGLLHARGDGPGAQRDATAKARAIEFYDVLSTFRFHELDADAVQLRHARARSFRRCYLTTVSGRPRRHLRGDQGKRAARQVRRRPGQRLDAGAGARLAHQGHERQVARAWCRS